MNDIGNVKSIEISNMINNHNDHNDNSSKPCQNSVQVRSSYFILNSMKFIYFMHLCLGEIIYN